MSAPPNVESRPASRQIARAAGTVMLAFFVTQVVGLVSTIIIYRAYGTYADLDSFNAANRVTEVLFNLMAGGALGSAFIPIFTGLLTHGEKPLAWRTASAIANLLLAVLTLITGLAIVFAPLIVRRGLFVLAPDLPAGEEELTVNLLRIMLPTVVIFGLSGLVMGILNAHQRFWLPAIAPAMFSLGQIGGVVLLPAGWGVYRLAVGALLGALLHLLIQSPGLLHLGGKYSTTLGLKIREVRQIILLMGPRILGVAIVQLNFIINTVIALSLPEGSVSAITLAFMLFLSVQITIAQSAAIAAMPTFSAQVALGKFNELRSLLASTLRAVLLLAIPATVGLIALRVPLVRFLYQKGEFTAHATSLVAWALLWYTAGLVGHSLVEVLARAFYSMHDTKTPVLIGSISMAFNVIFSLTFPHTFTRLGWMPIGGLALANSVATALEAVGLLVLIRRKLGGLEGRSVLDGGMRALIAALGMSLALWGWLTFANGRADWLAIAGCVILGSGVYGLGVWILGVPEARLAWKALIRRLHLRSQFTA